MESPPSFSTLSEAPPLSEDSGLLITSGSFSSDSASGWHHVASECQESDFDERSLSLCESTETSERMSGDFFNTVKKGPSKAVTAIEPPPEFQDNPTRVKIEPCALVWEPAAIISNDEINKSKDLSLEISKSSRHISPQKLKSESVYERRQCLGGRFASPRLLHPSPGRAGRPASRSSLSSRLSSSHNSLVTQFQTDDSSFITQAISHDTLSAQTSDIPDMYNVPFDSDIYAVPVDVVRPNQTNMKNKNKKFPRNNKKRGKSTPPNIGGSNLLNEKTNKHKEVRQKDVKSKRNSLPSSSCKKNMIDSDAEPVQHLTLKEMRKYLHALYSSSSDSESKTNTTAITKKNNGVINVSIHAQEQNTSANNVSSNASNAVFLTESKEVSRTVEANNNHKKGNKNSFATNMKSKKHKETGKENTSKEVVEVDKNDIVVMKKMGSNQGGKGRLGSVRMLSLNLKQGFCNLFRWRRGGEEGAGAPRGGVAGAGGASSAMGSVFRRALPPLPHSSRAHSTRRTPEEVITDFATSIQRVKDYGWYWGPITVEAAEKILSNEPDGSFIVRDSSDDHYIFTLTFKLNGLRHVRIEHDQGNFCFGGCTMFKASTIVEFIENAVETSRSGRYLFFLNLRPVLGPVRVQLLYPVSRFKRVQSLQHTCRFVILKYVRRDLISSLPLPRRMLDYLSCTHYYSELLAEI